MLSFTFYISTIEVDEYIEPNQIVIPKRVADLWRIQSSTSVTLAYHVLSVNTEVIVDPFIETSTLKVASNIQEKLSIPVEEKIQCIYDYNNNSFQLGPSFGVVVGDVRSHESAPFGPITPYFTEMAIKATEYYIPFVVFSYKKVKDSYVTGYVYRDNKWIIQEVPLPHVIYNRIGRRDQEWSKSGKSFFHYLKERNIPYFNDRFIHKWESIQYFYEEPTLHPFIPETRHLHSVEDVTEMLQKHSSIYIKPFWGREGSGIIRVDKNKDTDSFLLSYEKNNTWESKEKKTTTSIFSSLKERMKKRHYIMQQTINFGSNRPIDYRILCIKNYHGHWKVCSAVSRIGQQESLVSNLSKGAVQKKVYTTLKERMSPDQASHMERFLYELAVQCAEVLDIEAGGIYGELGFDFMIDDSDKVWILEVNMKPSKGEFQPMHGKTPPSIKYLLFLAASLAGFLTN
ncbi:YheC/YheD family protein [Evansella sp. AB-rgal1]|uniref:YheC/YheD family endospore coat-associated protein n=1 Tax=Evansella sp. AB-rgal1 TaxID=3242696 RepID=UPI00359E229F